MVSSGIEMVANDRSVRLPSRQCAKRSFLVVKAGNHFNIYTSAAIRFTRSYIHYIT